MPIDYARDALAILRTEGLTLQRGSDQFYALVDNAETEDDEGNLIGMELMAMYATTDPGLNGRDIADGDTVAFEGNDYTVRNLKNDGKGVGMFKLSDEVPS